MQIGANITVWPHFSKWHFTHEDVRGPSFCEYPMRLFLHIYFDQSTQVRRTSLILNLMTQHNLTIINHNSYSSQTWQLSWKCIYFAPNKCLIF